MELSDVWQWYCLQKLGEPNPLPPLEPISPEDTAMLLYEDSFVFSARFGIINETPYSTAFDDEADGALSALALNDSFNGWDEMSAGAWRVVYERFLYTEVVAAANAAARNPVMTHLPEGLDHKSRVRAVWLQFLLGRARAIDPAVLDQHKTSGLPAPQASKPIRRN